MSYYFTFESCLPLLELFLQLRLMNVLGSDFILILLASLLEVLIFVLKHLELSLILLKLNIQVIASLLVFALLTSLLLIGFFNLLFKSNLVILALVYVILLGLKLLPELLNFTFQVRCIALVSADLVLFA